MHTLIRAGGFIMLHARFNYEATYARAGMHEICRPSRFARRGNKSRRNSVTATRPLLTIFLSVYGIPAAVSLGWGREEGGERGD